MTDWRKEDEVQLLLYGVDSLNVASELILKNEV
jgi:hypothetical protein